MTDVKDASLKDCAPPTTCHSGFMCLRSFQSNGFSQQLKLISLGNSTLLVFTEKHVFVVSGCRCKLFYLEPCSQLSVHTLGAAEANGNVISFN